MKGDVQHFVKIRVDKETCVNSRQIHILATAIPTLHVTWIQDIQPKEV